MDLRAFAKEIYSLHWRAKEKAIATVPREDRWIVRHYLLRIGKARIIAAAKKGKGKHCWFRQPSCGGNQEGFGVDKPERTPE